MPVDKVHLLNLTVHELVALYGRLRALGVVYKYASHGVLTDRPGTLSSVDWKPLDAEKYLYEGVDRKTGVRKWTATRVDLIFGRHEELRGVCEVYGAGDGEEKFISDFVKVWTKLLHIDRFDLWRKDRKKYKELTRGI